jgi:hypothetical protein
VRLAGSFGLVAVPVCDDAVGVLAVDEEFDRLAERIANHGVHLHPARVPRQACPKNARKPAELGGFGGIPSCRAPGYTETMLERVTMKTLPLANKAAEHAPMAAVCCNACRTCVQTNILGLVAAGALGAASFAKRLIRRS